MCFNAIHENKIIAKISQFTVLLTHMVHFHNICKWEVMSRGEHYYVIADSLFAVAFTVCMSLVFDPFLL